MSTVNSFDKNQHFGELNSPLFTGNPVPTTPAARKAAARSNLGVSSTAEAATAMQTFIEAGVTNARFAEQPLQTQPAVTAFNATGTLTAAALLSGIITATSATAIAATLPLATDLNTALLAAYPALADNDSFDFSVINLGSSVGIVTITTNTGWTLVGNMLIPIAATGVDSSATFRLKRTSATAYILYRLA